MAKKLNKNNLPQTDSIEALARFWDTHDLTDFDEGLEEVSEPIFMQNQERTELIVHLKQEELMALTQLARAKGVAGTTLVREWVLEKLQKLPSST